ncbi:MAG: bifunctional proline dehydrogenase/L-glutamate gamma-semialdehyde dehydrogenase PutA [Alphaproteobacteria bacterium]
MPFKLKSGAGPLQEERPMTDLATKSPSASGAGKSDARGIPQIRSGLRHAIRQDEATCVAELLQVARQDDAANLRIADRAARLVHGVRAARTRFGGLDDFLQQFGLSTDEGVALMCLAEALLRIPDSETADKLIRDKIGHTGWSKHVGEGESVFVNASTWALMLTGKVLGDEQASDSAGFTLNKMVARLGEPVIRQAILHSMKILGRQFVLGRTIKEAMKRAREDMEDGYTHSFDMLGEGARTAADAKRYFQSYADAIDAIGEGSKTRGPDDGPGISVKLSALHPRYDYPNRDACVPELAELLTQLCIKAKAANIALCVDAEESWRLDMSLDILDAVMQRPELEGWDGFGLAVQAYQRRAIHVIDWLAASARKHGIRLMVRLVKGAYWDTEIKHAQVMGHDGYPVFTRKIATDVSYLACARRMIENRDVLYSAFATHNAQTVSAIMEMTEDADPSMAYEFQRLHGMGEPLYHQITGKKAEKHVPCRIYAPVGSHEDLLPYLVRRLLENGANSSFVNRISDDRLPVERLVVDPIETLRAAGDYHPHSKIPAPMDIFGDERRNSEGVDLTDPLESDPLVEAVAKHPFTNGKGPEAWALIGGKQLGAEAKSVLSPVDRNRVVGSVHHATADLAQQALEIAVKAGHRWSDTPVDQRATALEKIADLYEAERVALTALLVAEAGKTHDDADAEIREAVDFCRYYAVEARRNFGQPITLPGPTGESNQLFFHGRGVFFCISPWNFPLAIYTGQIVAALVTGNAVLAKPAEQTSLIAYEAVKLMHKAGIPEDVLHLLPGDGAEIGGALTPDERVSGVCFTGSTMVAKILQHQLADRPGAIVPLIAETGGQNAMIIDNTALPEQVVDDVIKSAFKSCGQRCSALRVLFLQEDTANKIIAMLKGAMDELVMGDPVDLRTDIGPVIDEEALRPLQQHIERLGKEAKLLHAPDLDAATARGTFLAPHVFEITSLDQLDEERFGPILHIIRWKRGELDKLVEQINATGYGLTFGIHSRIESRVEQIVRGIKVGNVYVNRNITGAVVGVQPFGGEGLSGTGPKAGGPTYLYRFCSEKAVSIDTTASGGNTSLVTLGDDME